MMLTGHLNSDFPGARLHVGGNHTSCNLGNSHPPPPHLKTGGCQNLWLSGRQRLHPTSFSPPLVSFLWGFPLCLKFSCLQHCSAHPASKQSMAQELLILTALPVDMEPGWSPTLIALEGPPTEGTRATLFFLAAFSVLTFDA